ncbi:MAG: hypothetical protein ACE5R4_15920 [Armatimonadota bacterium]
MALDMFHANEIAQSIRLLCQSGVALTDDCAGSATVTVGSNELFEVSDAVEVLDDDSAPESGVVAGKSGLNTITLESPVTGPFEVSQGAWIRLATPRLAGLKFVAQGRPELIPEPRAERFPCLIVQPGEVRQSGSEGTNKAFAQEYDFHLYYVRKSAAGEEQSAPALEEAGALFSLLMEDTYLGGTCWASHVTRVAPNNDFDRQFKERNLPLDVIQLDLRAKRLEGWPK